MPKGTAFDFGRILSDLTGKRVTVTQSSTPFESSKNKAYGVFDVFPERFPALLGADLPLLASLGGALMGMPDALIRSSLSDGEPNDALKDAMHEVLNILSSVLLSEGRPVLRAMELREQRGFLLFSEMTRRPTYQNKFSVTLPGYTGGEMVVITPASRLPDDSL